MIERERENDWDEGMIILIIILYASDRAKIYSYML